MNLHSCLLNVSLILVLYYYYFGLFSYVRSVTLSRCELATDLKNILNETEWSHFGIWICIAEKSSELNTSLNKTHLEDGNKKVFHTYGVFQLSSNLNCNDKSNSSSPTTTNTNICGKSCADFMDTNVTDDILCGLKSLNPNNVPNQFSEAYRTCSWLNVTYYEYTYNCSGVGIPQTNVPNFINLTEFRTFHHGSSNEELICESFGSPPPELRWSFDYNKYPELKSETCISTDNTSSIVLKFPQITSRYEGEYNCVAKYTGGISVTQKWKVTIEPGFNYRILLICLGVPSFFGGIILLVVLARKIEFESSKLKPKVEDKSSLLNNVEETESTSISTKTYNDLLIQIKLLLSSKLSNPTHGGETPLDNLVVGQTSHNLANNSANSNSNPSKSTENDVCPICSYFQRFRTSIKRINVDGSPLEINEHIGDGISSSVHRGLYFIGNYKEPAVQVVVKILHKSSSSSSTLFNSTHRNTNKSNLEVDILKELKGGDFIVETLGYHEEEEFPTILYKYIVLEYCQRGSLKNFLDYISTNSTVYPDEGIMKIEQDNPYILLKQYNVKHLLDWTIQVALALEFVESKGIVHGDVSARNVLLTGFNDVKLGDFGHSRWMSSDLNNDREEPWPPWAWRPPGDEPLTFATDVWAFGVLLWETFSLGGDPCTKITPEGDRTLPQPDFASPEMYALMKECWNLDSNSRIKIKLLRLQLQGIQYSMSVNQT